MNRSIDITLTAIHIGAFHTVVTLGLDGKDLAEGFLSKLLHDDRKKWQSIQTRIQSVADYESYENKTTFRHVGEGVFEFKRPGLRLYAFYDTLEGSEHLILCSNGGLKNSKKEQQTDIAKAKSLKRSYLRAKENPNTILTFKDLK